MNPNYPKLRHGNAGHVRVYTCSRCVAMEEGSDESVVVARLARSNRGPSSISHGLRRVAKFKECFDEVKINMNVLVGFALSEDGELALRRATVGVGVGIEPSSTGAPPATEEVAAEVGRPMVSPRAPPPPSEGDASDWNMVEDRRRPKGERNRGNGPPEPARFSEHSRGPGSPNPRRGSENPPGGSENLVPGRVRRTRPVLVARSPYGVPF